MSMVLNFRRGSRQTAKHSQFPTPAHLSRSGQDVETGKSSRELSLRARKSALSKLSDLEPAYKASGSPLKYEPVFSPFPEDQPKSKSTHGSWSRSAGDRSSGSAGPSGDDVVPIGDMPKPEAKIGNGRFDYSGTGKRFRDGGEEALLRFIRASAGARAESLAIRLKNKTPVKSGHLFSYTIRQGSEERDLREIDRLMSSGRLYRAGMLLQGGAWSRLLLGSRYALGASRKQVHELWYKRKTCGCLACRVNQGKQKLIERVVNGRETEKGDKYEAGDEETIAKNASGVFSTTPGRQTRENGGNIRLSSNSGNFEIVKEPGSAFWDGATRRTLEERAISMPAQTMRRSPRRITELTEDFPSLGDPSLSDMLACREEIGLHCSAGSPLYEAFAPEFVIQRDAVLRVALPAPDALVEHMQAVSLHGELLIGELSRVNSRAAKLRFADDIRSLFGNIAYTGPMSNQAFYNKVVSMGVDYYRVHRGKKNRKVYVRGSLTKIDIPVGVVKPPRQPLVVGEVGSNYVLYAAQTLLVYSGTIMLEGNHLGSFIDTGMEFYIGFGTESGAAAVYPHQKPMGAPRRLGVNELLLHHHMTEELAVCCR